MTQAMSEPSSPSADLPPPVTLRTLIAQRKKAGERFKLAEVVAIVVPITTELAATHERGETVYVHPSSIGAGADGLPRLVPQLARVKPSDPADLAAIAPELAQQGACSPRSSVFGLGAIVYEMLTLQTVGPGMKPPTQLHEGLPPIVDQILAKALVQDPAQRPDDLPAFAQAIHHFAPQSVAPPPAVDEHAFEVDIDMRTSMLPVQVDIEVPKAPKAPVIPDDPFGAVVDARASAPSAPRTNKAVEELAALKARLEADPAPRWIVVKDKMDHGPFAAIELLQQIASDTFAPDDLLVDTHQGSRMAIKDHPEFSRFAHHANLKREQIAEAKAVVAAEKREKTAGAAKGTIAAVVVVGVLAVVGLVVWRIRASAAADEAKKKSDDALVVAGEGSVKGKEKDKPKVAAGGGGGGGGGWGGKSYDEAMKNTVSDSESETLSVAECAAPVGGGIAANCGLNGKATAKYYVKNGKAVGVSVTTDPPQPGVNSCMAAAIGGLSWKSVSGATGCIRTFKAN